MLRAMIRTMFRTMVLSIITIMASNSYAKPFVFTAIPDQDETQLQQRFGKVAQYLQQTLNVEVSYIPVKSYTAAVSAFRNNQVQLAWFGGLSGVQARRLVPGSTAIAQGYEDQFFKTYLIAHRSTNLQRQDHINDQIARMTFTFGSKGSTSGRLMPEFYLREHFKQSPDEIFTKVGFSGDHSRTIALVQSGAYQVGAVNYKVWEKELADGKIDTDKVSVIWETPDYPDYQWTIRGDVDAQWGEHFTHRVQQALLAIKDPEILKSFPRQSFVPASNDDYQPILNTAKSIGIIE